MFSRESLLVDVLCTQIARMSLRSGVNRAGNWRHVEREFHVDDVIPDLVLVDHRARSSDSGLKITRKQAHVLRRVVDRPGRPITDFYQTWRGTDGLSTLLRPLITSGLLSFNEAELSLNPSATLRNLPRSIGITAIEAKASRWRDALAQALSYHSFANQVFVAFPAGLIEARPEIVEECKPIGIGVLAVSRRNVKMVSPAPYRRLWTDEWLWAISKAVGLPRTAGETMRFRLPAERITAAVPNNWAGLSEYELLTETAI